jgi:hypothetical protein
MELLMPTSTKQKRLDKIELQLSPREWAIRMADEARKYPSDTDFAKAFAKRTYREWPITKPFYALIEQTEERYPGKNWEDIQARNKLGRKLRTEFHFFATLFFVVNEAIAGKIGSLGLKATLNLSRLRTLILRDAFGRTASRAALWIEECKTADTDGEEERQMMLKELASYQNVSLAEEPSDTVPFRTGLHVRFRSLIKFRADDLTMLILDVFSYKAAVRAIEKKYFDGHLILSRHVEAKLEETIRLVEGAVATFNEYLRTRSELCKENGDQEDQEDGSTSATPDEREGQLSIDIDAIQKYAGTLIEVIASEWAKGAKESAVAVVYRREETGRDEPYAVQSLRRKLGMKL